MTRRTPAPTRAEVDATTAEFEAYLDRCLHATPDVVRTLTRRFEVLAWNTASPSLCPACGAVATVSAQPAWWKVHACPACSARFTRWPALARALPDAASR